MFFYAVCTCLYGSSALMKPLAQNYSFCHQVTLNLGRNTICTTNWLQEIKGFIKIGIIAQILRKL